MDGVPVPENMAKLEKARKRRRLFRKYRGLFYVLPWIIGFLVFKFYPFIMSLVYLSLIHICNGGGCRQPADKGPVGLDVKKAIGPFGRAQNPGKPLGEGVGPGKAQGSGKWE